MKLFYPILVLLIVVGVSSVSAKTDQKATPIVEKVKAEISRLKSYRVDLVTTGPSMGRVTGSLLVSGRKYYLNLGDNELFYDGKILQSLSHANREVTVEEGASSTTFLGDPRSLLELNSDVKGLVITYLREEKNKNGEPLHALRYDHPSLRGQGSLVVFVNGRTWHPERIEFTARRAADNCTILVTRFTENFPAKDSDFQFDKKKYPGVEVIDFR